MYISYCFRILCISSRKPKQDAGNKSFQFKKIQNDSFILFYIFLAKIFCYIFKYLEKIFNNGT